MFVRDALCGHRAVGDACPFACTTPWARRQQAVAPLGTQRLRRRSIPHLDAEPRVARHRWRYDAGVRTTCWTGSVLSRHWTSARTCRTLRAVTVAPSCSVAKLIKSERLSPLQALAPSFVRGVGWCSGATARTRATRVTVDGHQPLRMREMGRLNGGQCLAQVRGCARLVFAHSCTRGRLLCDGCVARCPRGLVVRRLPVRTRIGSRRAPGRRWRWLGARR